MPGILVVEDDENLNRGITFSLKKSGYEVFSAESVKKAKRIASDNDVDITSAETKATYDEIKKYVAEHNAGMKVSNLYISQVKRKCGIEVGKNYNLPKNEDSRQPQCPEDKESAIVEALKHFKMIQKK